MARVMQQCVAEEEIGYCEIEMFLMDYLATCGAVSFERSGLSKEMVTFQERSLVEARPVIQPIPVCILTNSARDSVLVVQKNKKAALKGSPERDKWLLYVGGHTRLEDSYGYERADLLSICQTALEREVEEEIGLKIDVTGIMPFVVYHPDCEKSKRHMAICYVVEVNTKALHLKLSSQELCLPTDRGKSGRFVNIKEIKQQADHLESWSKEILKFCF